MMTTRVNVPSSPVTPLAEAMPVSTWPTPPWTLEERLQRIEAMGQRISGYIRFICQVGSLGGSSTEAKERAVAAFYDRLAAAEGQLSRIQEDLRLG
jgi:hypothetical protein